MEPSGIKPVFYNIFFAVYTALFIVAVCEARAQQDTFQLRAIQVIDSAPFVEKRYVSLSFDSVQYAAANGLDGGEFFAQNSGLYVKDYGPGTTSTLSYRGGTAYHTKVFWEGISVDNAMLGQSDLSLYNFDNSTSMRFLKGGNSLMLGSGGFGGIVDIHNGQSHWDGLEVEASYTVGSFNTRKLPVSIFMGNGKWKFEASLVKISAENDFPYKNYLDGDKIAYRENASFSRIQAMPKISYRIGKNQEVSFAYWHTYSNREVPSAIGTSASEARQTDVWNKAMISWSRKTKNLTVKASSYLSKDEMVYENHFSNIYSENMVASSRNLLNADLKLTPHLILGSQVKADFIKVESNNYDEAKIQRLLGVYESLSLQRAKYFARANIRLEQPAKTRIFAMPSLNVGCAPITGLPKTWIFSNVSYNVRFPSFNELYWQDVGNPDLKEETSRSMEIGLDQEIKRDRVSLKMLASLFHSEVSQLIVWLPSNGLWRPENVGSVRNKGLELELKTSAKMKRCQFFLNAGYIYTSSVIVENPEFPETVGKQQVYIPEHKAQMAMNLEWASYVVSVNQVVTGMAYINSDNHTYIPFSAPVNLELAKKMEVKEALITIKAGARNILDEDYQYVAHMPMPKRNYYLSILFHFNHIKS